MEGASQSEHRYIALLRGINVGGHSKVKMSDLKEAFISLGFTDVITYIQTGNVLFTTNIAHKRLTDLIEERLKLLLGYKITLFILTPVQLQEAAVHNPFIPRYDEAYSHLVFLSEEPNKKQYKFLMAKQGSIYRFKIRGKVLYYSYDKKYAGNRPTIDFEKILGVTATSRSWKVVDELIELLKQQK